MSNPRLILMDEPSEGLAPVIVTQLGQLLRGLGEHGHSILLVEQNVSLALAVDCVPVQATGRVVHEGPIADIARAAERPGEHLGCEGSIALSP